MDDDIDKADEFKKCFVSQIANYRTLRKMTIYFKISEDDVEDILKCLDTSKATGHDLNSPGF